MLVSALPLLATLVPAALGPAGEIDAALTQHLASIDAAEPVRCILVLEERWDTTALVRASGALPVRERAGRVRDELRERATRSRAALDLEVGRLADRGLVQRAAPLWNVNALRLTATRAAIEELAAHPSVALARWDPVLPGEATRDATAAPLAPLVPLVPFAPGGSPPAELNIVQHQAPDAWSLGIDGGGVLVLEIDDGVANNHPALSQAIWSNPNEVANGLDDDGNGYVDDLWGWDFASNDNSPYGTGHGTNVAGILCGDGANNGGVVTGMAPGIDLAVARIFSEGDVLEAMQYAVDIGARVVSCSHSIKFPFDPAYHLFRQAADVELAAGIVHANSSGNTGEVLFTYPVPYNIPAPANCPSPWTHPAQMAAGRSAVLAVGGIWIDDTLYNPGGRGPAAWEDVTLTDPFYPWPQDPAMWDYPWSGGTLPGLLKPDLAGYTGVRTTAGPASYTVAFGGTSAATPHVGGALALLVDANDAVPPRQIAQALQETALDLGPLGKDERFGAGKFLVRDALERIYAAVTAYPFEPNPGDQVDLVLTGPAGIPYALVVGTQPGKMPTGLGFDVEIANPVVLASGLLTGTATPVTYSYPLYGGPGISGIEFYLQLIVDDRTGATGKVLRSLVERVRIQ